MIGPVSGNIGAAGNLEGDVVRGVDDVGLARNHLDLLDRIAVGMGSEHDDVLVGTPRLRLGDVPRTRAGVATSVGDLDRPQEQRRQLRRRDTARRRGGREPQRDAAPVLAGPLAHHPFRGQRDLPRAGLEGGPIRRHPRRSRDEVGESKGERPRLSGFDFRRGDARPDRPARGTGRQLRLHDVEVLGEPRAHVLAREILLAERVETLRQEVVHRRDRRGVGLAGAEVPGLALGGGRAQRLQEVAEVGGDLVLRGEGGELALEAFDLVA